MHHTTRSRITGLTSYSPSKTVDPGDSDTLEEGYDQEWKVSAEVVEHDE